MSRIFIDVSFRKEIMDVSVDLWTLLSNTSKITME